MAYHSAINMAPHQPCDSYFVETDDTTAISAAERLQYESIIKRQRQERIADELSMEVRAEYLPEIVDHMAAMEVRNSRYTWLSISY